MSCNSFDCENYSIKPIQKKGLGVVSTNIIHCTDVVMKNEVVGCCLFEKEWMNYCDYCLSVLPGEYVQCACGMNYCNKICQNKALEQYHFSECKILQETTTLPPNISTILLLHRLSLLTTFEFNKYHQIPWDTRTVEHCIMLFQSKSSLIQLIANVIRANSFNITDDEEKPIGVSFYSNISRINHSCQPNSIPIRNGREMIIKAIYDIPKETEITICYIDIATPFQERQMSLSTWGFHCHCSRCEEDITKKGDGVKCSCGGEILIERVSLYIRCLECKKISEIGEEDYERIMNEEEEINRIYQESKELFKNKKYKEVVKKLSISKEIADSLYFHSNLTYFGIISLLFHSYISLNQWSNAFTFADFIAENLSVIYPKYYITAVLEHFRLAKLYRIIGMDELSQKEYNLTKEGLEICKGCNQLQKICDDWYVGNTFK